MQADPRAPVPAALAGRLHAMAGPSGTHPGRVIRAPVIDRFSRALGGGWTLARGSFRGPWGASGSRPVPAPVRGSERR
jgi:hypothetical protein